MTIFLIALGIGAGVLVVAYCYWKLLLSIYPEQIHTNEVHTIVTSDLWKLRLCRYRKGRTGGEPVLLVHGLNANQHNFTVPADASLVDHLVSKGFDCWCIDLRGSRSSAPPFEYHRRDAALDDFLIHDLPTAVKYIKDATRYPKVHWIGHSLGGMLLYAYVQEYGDDDIASATTLGSPLGFDGVDMQWLEDAVFFVSRLPGFFGPLMRAYIPMGDKLRLGVPLFPTNMRNLAGGLTSAEVFNVIDEVLPHVLRTMAGWASNEEWLMKDGALKPAEGLGGLKVPLLAFYGPEDPFVPLDRAKAFIKALPHDDKEIIILSKENGCHHDYSHCEQLFGKGARREVFEPIAHWLTEHPVAAPSRDFDGTEPVHLASLKPLDRGARTDILSGSSFAHLVPGRESAPPAAKKTGKKALLKKKTVVKRKARAKKTDSSG